MQIDNWQYVKNYLKKDEFMLMKNSSILWIKFRRKMGVIRENCVYDSKGTKIQLIEHSYNCGNKNERMTERSLELALAKNWMKSHNENMIEVGAVTPYYGSNQTKRIVDPYDKHKLVTDRCSLFEIDMKDMNILSISTVEHVGMGDYGIREKKNSIQAIRHIFLASKSCLITYPMGYNKQLDAWTVRHFKSKYISLYSRGFLDNDWNLCTSAKQIKKYGPLWANTIAVIEKI